jgi:hypothetical protein
MNKDIIYTPNEKEFYDYLFTNYKQVNSDFIGGGEVVKLFLKSGLEKVF